ncbi:pentapeptide repeat-containing protein [Streptomyces sp. NPDC057696]|uniref:pentapeptide repeat-containing protein n=1 Tax=Streptomyces sp. NPDC057696 TaxID=3346218 RepID=UPI0036CA84EA
MSSPKQPPPSERSPIRILSWRIVIISFLAACGLTALTTWALVTATDSQTVDQAKIAAVKINAIRTGLAVGAGAGGAMALLLAARKQWLGERSQSHQEDVAHSDISDATERRITDLYGKAVDQLGSDKAAVRIGGIFALERLAQANPGHRQTIIDVICAYLRMPFTIPPQVDLGSITPHTLQGSVASDETRQEIQVRLTAQDLLRRRLSKNEADSESHWGGLRIDLTGATLVTFNLTSCEFREGVFTDSHFAGTTRFNYSKSTSSSSFRGAHFSGFTDFAGFGFAGKVRFDDSRFAKSCSFEEAEFDQGARFDKVIFADQAIFKRSNFHNRAIFDNAVFSGEAIFTEADFIADVQFLRVIFKQSARFGQSRFRGATTFTTCAFEKDARLGGSRFEGRLRLREVTFAGAASFGECKFTEGLYMRGVTFQDVAKFGGSRMTSGASLREVTFEKAVTFTGTPTSRSIVFYGVHFDDTASFHKTGDQSVEFKNSSILNNDQMIHPPRNWLVSSQADASGRYEIVRWNPPMILP